MIKCAGCSQKCRCEQREVQILSRITIDLSVSLGLASHLFYLRIALTDGWRSRNQRNECEEQRGRIQAESFCVTIAPNR